ncbi:MAG TPA: YtxH domain-containing protein [Actinobacteria bacterium]|nr:YtxH domain-containing protein [Actinomycetota bacterium]
MAEKKGGFFRSLFSFILGGVTGAIGGLLLAPRSGKETRERLKIKGEELIESGKKSVLSGGEDLKSKVEDATKKLKEKVGEVTEAVKEKAEKTR